MSSFRTLFPYFKASSEVYLDTAATSQRINHSVLAMQEYYYTYNANVHRGTYPSARIASNKYEQARVAIAGFVGAQNPSNIIFTSGATDAINLVANGLDINDLSGKEILLCESEHHANFLPWQHFAAKHNMLLKKISLNNNGTFNEQSLETALNMLTQNVAILAIAHVSNVLGNIYPVAQLCDKAASVNTLSVVDGTQAAAHIKIDVEQINCDFYTISGHKMYAGTGIGILYGKQERLESLHPSKLGGEMITQVTWQGFELQAPPTKFEAGTPNIAGALGMAAAASFIQENLSQIRSHELKISRYLLAKLSHFVDTNKIVILGNIGVRDIDDDACQANASVAVGIVSFYSPIMHANDIASELSNYNIAVRAGHHCAMPLMHSLKLEGCVRVSLGCYTSFTDVDNLIKGLDGIFTSQFATHHKRLNDNNSSLGGDSLITSSTVIESAIKNARDWNEKHRMLLIHSKRLPILTASQRNENNLIEGCEAKVWIAFCKNHQDTSLLAYSHSKVIRGILALIIEKVNSLENIDVQAFNFTGFLHDIGLSHYFSEGRRDGIQKIIGAIQTFYAKATLTSAL